MGGTSSSGLSISAKGDSGFGSLLISFNNGINWEPLETGLPYYIPIHRIKYTGNGNLLLGMSCGILRSEDDGDTFEQVSQTGGNILNFNISPENEIYAVGWNTILRSLNDGVTWDTVVFTPSNTYFSDIDFGLNGELYTVGGSYDGPGTGSGFQRSFDHGNTWENMGLTDTHINFIEVNNEGEIIVGGGETSIFSSNDLGDSWTQLSDMLLTAIESNSQDNLIAGVDGYDYKGCRFSEDWGINWQNVNDSVLNPYINQISISPPNTV